MDKNIKIASELIKLANQLIAFENDGTTNDSITETQVQLSPEEQAKIEELQKKIDALADMFETEFAERIAALQQANAKAAELQRQLKSDYKQFDKRTGYKKMITAAEEELLAYQKTGGNISLIKTKWAISVGKSKQPSYKEWLQVVLTLLNEQTYNKFVQLLQAFKKNTATIKTGVPALDVSVKEWSKEAEDAYKERGFDNMPKASRMAGIMDTITDWSNKFFAIFKGVINWCNKLIASFMNNTNEINNLNDTLETILTNAPQN